MRINIDSSALCRRNTFAPLELSSELSKKENCYWHMLSDEVESLVFEYVGTIDVVDADVARHFRRFSNHAFLRLLLVPSEFKDLRQYVHKTNVHSCNALFVDFVNTTPLNVDSHLSAIASVLKKKKTRVESLHMIGDGLFHIGKITEALRLNVSLRILDVSNNKIDSDCGVQLGKVLSVNTTLEKLNLSSNCLRSDGIIEILKSLKINQSLAWLDISDNSNVAETRMDECATILNEVLKVNNSLKHLDISQNDIGDEAAVVIAEGLKQNKTLEKLNVFGQYVLHRGIVALADMLKTNITLKILDAGSCHAYLDTTSFPDTQPGIALGEALKVNRSLKVLRLTDFGFSTEDAIGLSEGLRVNSSLEKLNLYENNIGSKGIMAIANALSYNTSLQELNVECSSFDSGGSGLVYPDMDTAAANDFAVVGYNELALSLRMNHSLKRLWIGADGVQRKDGIKVLKSFAQALEYNCGLEELHINFEGLCEDDGVTAFQHVAKFNDTCRIFIANKELIV